MKISIIETFIIIGITVPNICSAFPSVRRVPAQTGNANYGRPLQFVQEVFSSKAALPTVMNEHLHQRNRRRSTAFFDGPKSAESNLLGAPKNEYGNFLGNLLSLIRKKKYGDPVRVDLPSLGLCNRKTCADLYQHLENFRNSDFFINMQTFFSLVQDEDGLDLIYDVLRDPKLLQQVMRGGGGLLGGGRGSKTRPKPPTISSINNPPRISSSIDSAPGSIDFDFSNYDYDSDESEASKSSITQHKPEETIRVPNSNPQAAQAQPEQSIRGLRGRKNGIVQRAQPPGFLPAQVQNHGLVEKPRSGNQPSLIRPSKLVQTRPTGYRREEDPYYVMYFDDN